jgi:hypothetical protein
MATWWSRSSSTGVATRAGAVTPFSDSVSMDHSFCKTERSVA